MNIRIIVAFLSFILFAASDSFEAEVVVSVTRLRAADITDIKVISENDIILATQSAGWLKSTDGGINFSRFSSLSNQTLFNNNGYYTYIDGTTIYLGGGSKNFVFSPGFHVSTDGGNNFEYKGFEGRNIPSIIKYNNKILLAPRGLGVQSFENNTIAQFNNGIEQANVSRIYFDGNNLVAGTDINLFKYNDINQIWEPTVFNQGVVDIISGSNDTDYVASLDKIFATTDFTNFIQLPDLDPGEFFNFKTIAYNYPYLFAGIEPINHANNIALVHRLNLNTNIWGPDTAGLPQNPGIPQSLSIFGGSMLLGTSSGLYSFLNQTWQEALERLSAGQITNVGYNESNNSIWAGGAQGDVRVAFDINGEWTKNDWGLSLGVQINDFAYTPTGTFTVPFNGLYFQENIGDRWEKRMSGLSSNGYTSIAYNPNSGKTILLGFDKVYVSSDLGIQWTTELTGNFDQVEYSAQQDKFYVSDLSSLLSSDGTVINFQTFAQNVFPLDFAIKDDPSDWKIGLASFDNFYEIDESGSTISLGLNGLPSGSFVEKVSYNSSADTWEGSYDDKIVVLNTNTNQWDEIAQLQNYVPGLTRIGSSNNSSSFGADILLVATLGGGLYASASAVGISDDKKIIIDEFKLEQNYPNPFNPLTSIRYSIPKAAFVSIKIYNLVGEEIATIVNEVKSAGNYQIKFNALGLTNGIYFYKLQAGNFTETKKMVLLK